MKKIFTLIIGLLILPSIAFSQVNVLQGGTGQTSFPANSIITSDGNPFQRFIATSSNPLYVGAIFASSTGNNYFLGNVGIGTTGPASKLAIYSGDDKDTGPIINLGGNAVNQFESGRLRFTETNMGVTPWYQGAFIHYDGSANTFNIGVHNTGDALAASDINAISILRSNGNVGIGTTTPWGKLAVEGGASGNSFVVSDIADNTDFVITNAGNVGIGTTSPQHALTVSGTDEEILHLNNSTSLSGGDWYGVIGNGTNFANGYFVFSQGTPSASNYELQFLGTGVAKARTAFAAPSFNSFITGRGDSSIMKWTNTGGNFNGTLAVGQDYPNGVSNVELIVGEAAGSYIRVRDNANNEFLRVTDTGYLGLGTTSPTTLLTVGSTTPDSIAAANYYNSAFIAGDLEVDGTIYGTLPASNISLTKGYVLAGDPSNQAAATSTLFIDGDNGYVGIGTTSPWGQLSVEGQGTNPAFVVSDTANNTDFIVDNQGNVGIGTTSPYAKLSVLGNSATAPAFVIATNTDKTVFSIDSDGIEDVKYGIHCQIGQHDTMASQSIPTGTTYTKITSMASTTPATNTRYCSPDLVNSKVVITRAGVYEVTGSINFSGGVNSTFFGAVFIDGIEQNFIHFQRKIAANDSGSASLTGQFTATSSTEVDFRVRHDQGGSIDFDPMYMNLNIKYLGK